jgi:hypothetical protein
LVDWTLAKSLAGNGVSDECSVSGCNSPRVLEVPLPSEMRPWVDADRVA